jgi:TPR repeat protein
MKIDFLENRTRLLEGTLSRLSAERERYENGLLATEQAYRRGCEYLFGANGFKDGKRLSQHLGLLQLKRAADAGHADAQYEYGRCQRDGIGCEADCVRGAEYLRRSAEQGSSYAQTAFGRCLENGLGVVKDLDRAAEFYRLSAEQCNSSG